MAKRKRRYSKHGVWFVVERASDGYGWHIFQAYTNSASAERLARAIRKDMKKRYKWSDELLGRLIRVVHRELQSKYTVLENA